MLMKKPHIVALERAIQIAGSQAALADGIAKFMGRPTISQQTISKWLRNETLIAAEYWPAFEHVTSGQVTRVDLRPDVFVLSDSASAFHEHAA
jgi:DNA-binding transcriptional regulator YdaS (Cro superfamily)